MICWIGQGQIDLNCLNMDKKIRLNLLKKKSALSRSFKITTRGVNTANFILLMKTLKMKMDTHNLQWIFAIAALLPHCSREREVLPIGRWAQQTTPNQLWLWRRWKWGRGHKVSRELSQLLRDCLLQIPYQPGWVVSWCGHNMCSNRWNGLLLKKQGPESGV